MSMVISSLLLRPVSSARRTLASVIRHRRRATGLGSAISSTCSASSGVNGGHHQRQIGLGEEVVDRLGQCLVHRRDQSRVVTGLTCQWCGPRW